MNKLHDFQPFVFLSKGVRRLRYVVLINKRKKKIYKLMFDDAEHISITKSSNKWSVVSGSVKKTEELISQIGKQIDDYEIMQKLKRLGESLHDPNSDPWIID